MAKSESIQHSQEFRRQAVHTAKEERGCHNQFAPVISQNDAPTGDARVPSGGSIRVKLEAMEWRGEPSDNLPFELRIDGFEFEMGERLYIHVTVHGGIGRGQNKVELEANPVNSGWNPWALVVKTCLIAHCPQHPANEERKEASEQMNPPPTTHILQPSREIVLDRVVRGEDVIEHLEMGPYGGCCWRVQEDMLDGFNCRINAAGAGRGQLNAQFLNDCVNWKPIIDETKSQE